MIVQRRYCRCGDVEFKERGTTGIWVCRRCGLMTKPYAMGREQQIGYPRAAPSRSAVVSDAWATDVTGNRPRGGR